MSKYPVESNIPISRPLRNKSRYEFKRLEVGDSIFIPSPDVKVRKWVTRGKTIYANNITSAAFYYSKVHNIKLVTRTAIKNGVTGIRVWRVK